MSKKIDYRTRLDPDNIPVTKKEVVEKKKREKLGLLSRKKLAQPISFRMRPHIIDMLNKLVVDINKQARMRLTKIAVLELCIQHAAKDKTIEELVAFYHENVL